jgi:hypothetical protein
LIALLEGVRGGWRWVYTCWPPSLRPTHTAAYTDRGKDTLTLGVMALRRG